MTYKCKICGGQTTVDSQNGIVICEYCGTKQALPLFTNDSERLLYESGNNYLSHGEYDKAENVFNQLLTIKPNASELYWDLVLCKYGVTYVKDPKTEKYIPTCNRTHYTPIFSDENYKKAVELSSGEKKALFEDDAKTIDNIQKGIIAVSKKEKPFDIFISYKETDANGNRTKDSVEAQKLYEKLTEAGYKVFFSRITLEDKIGTEYEPYIYAALYSSKVMITVSSSKENIEAVWVKNEWSRFLGFRQNDDSKTLLPLYFNMEKSDLPDEFALLSSYDMKKDGFEQELLRGIKKLIPLPIMKAKQRKKRTKILIGLLAVICVLGAIGTAAALVNKKISDKYNSSYEKAMQLYYDGKYAEAAWAFKELGDYSDSPEQQAKAELSWRKSLATVAVSNYDFSGKSAYYITPNGTVDTLSSAPGNMHSNISISEHGKVISIALTDAYNGSPYLYALHEDGYVSNAKENNKMEDDSEWHDIIKISCGFYGTSIALRNDGKIVIGNVDSHWVNANSDWAKELAKWENIVDFTYIAHGDPNNDAFEVATVAIVGIKADGSLCYVTMTTRDDSDFQTNIDYGTYLDTRTKEITERFKNVKSFALDYSIDSEGAIAVDKDNNLCILKSDGEMITEKGDFSRVYESVLVVKQNGDLYEPHSKRILAYDIVHSQLSHFISRSGKLYEYTYDGNIIEFDEKTIVYDEWIRGLN